MSTRISRLLLDTNVWLDNYLPDRPRTDVVRRMMTMALEQDVELAFCPTTAKDVFFVVERLYRGVEGTSKHVAWACVDNMSELGTPVACDLADVWYARKLRGIHGDFEDDLVIAAAQRCDADYLVTSDTRLVERAPIATATPHDVLELLAIQQG